MSTATQALALHTTSPNSIRVSIMDDDWPKKVAAFRDLFDLSKHNNISIATLADDRQRLHTALHAEEFAEYMGEVPARQKEFAEICARNVHLDLPLAERVDACLDLIYTLLGELLETGLSAQQINILMEEVHASNCTKTDSTGKPIFSDTGKVLKGDNYIKADIAGLLASWGYSNG